MTKKTLIRSSLFSICFIVFAHGCTIFNSDNRLHGQWTAHAVIGVDEFTAGLTINVDNNHKGIMFYDANGTLTNVRFSILYRDSLIEIKNSKIQLLNGIYNYKVVQDKKEYSTSFMETLHMSSAEVQMLFKRYSVTHRLKR